MKGFPLNCSTVTRVAGVPARTGAFCSAQRKCSRLWRGVQEAKAECGVCCMHQGLEGMSVPERAWELWDSGVRRRGGGSKEEPGWAELSSCTRGGKNAGAGVAEPDVGMGQRKLCRMGILQVTAQE